MSRKTVLVMKLVSVLLITALLQASAAGYAQRINLSHKDVALEKVFWEISHQSGYEFFYDADVLKGTKPVSVHLRNVHFEQALKQIFADQPLTYVISKHTIIVKRKPVPAATPRPEEDEAAILAKQVTGTVRDSVQVLPGASVRIKGTNAGTSTDMNGKFILDVPDENAVLIFSMVGYESQEIPVSGRNVLNVTLRSAAGTLDDVVVVAFGKQKKTDVIGAITSINPKDLKVPSSNLTTALAGRLSGVIAYQRSGEPGADNAAFFIRGVTTFGYNRSPLILIDNIEVTTQELARLQPDDIENFSILKDATATSLYGARGANGVILVATKEGKAGKAKINFRLENTVSTPTKNVELADPVTYMELENEAYATRNPLLATPYSQYQIDNVKAGTNEYFFPANDWRKQLFNDYAFNQRANFSVNGGGEVAQYYIAGTFNKDNGVLKVDKRNNFNNNIDLKTYQLRSNITINLTKSTRVVARLTGTFDDYTGPIDGGAGMYRKVMRANPVRFPATFPADEARQFTQHTLFGNSTSGSTPDGGFLPYLNPYADMVRGFKDYSKSIVIAQFELKQDLAFLTEGLSFTALGSTTRQAYFDISRAYRPFYYETGGIYDRTKDSYTLVPINETGPADFVGTEYLDFSEGDKLVEAHINIQTGLTYNRTFAKKHGVSGLLIMQTRNRIEANANSLQESLPYRNVSLSGRTTYSYDNRYFAELNFGYNGSERFYKTERYGFFPSVGVAWHASNEAFMEPYRSTITKLKFRATYGLVGNDAIGSASDRFFYLSNVNMNDASRGAVFGLNNDYSQNGITVTRYDNRDITWETSRQSNLGVELGLFGNINIQADYFRTYRDNILMTRASIPTTMGLSAATRANVGEAASSGIDMSLDYSQSFRKDVWASARVNFTYATSEFRVYEEPQYNEKNLSRIGYPLDQTWGYIAERLFVDQHEVDNSPRQNFGPYSAGDIKYRDVNGDGEITTLDQVPIGYPVTPEIIYGFGFSAGMKHFDLSAFFQGSARSSFWINTTNSYSDGGSTEPFVSYRYSSGDAPGVILQNQLLKAYAESHWSEENRNLFAIWPRLSNVPNANNNQTSTWFMRDGSFLRVKSVVLGYTLPRRITQRAHIEHFRVYAEGTNLFLFSKHKLWDVEMGAEGLGYPLQKVYNIGFQLTF